MYWENLKFLKSSDTFSKKMKFQEQDFDTECVSVKMYKKSSEHMQQKKNANLIISSRELLSH